MAELNTLMPPDAPTGGPVRRPRRRLLTLLGVLLVVTGLSFVGVYVYEAYYAPVIDVQGASQQVEKVKKDWAQGKKPAARIPGNAVGLMRIPEFGDRFEVAVVAGTTPYALSVGVGWFDGTAGPGEVGNFAVAGHRGASGPFVPLLDLEPGSRVIVETRDATHIYALTNTPKNLTVDKHETWVIDPVPGQVDAEPTRRLITLVTCRNFFHSPERSIAFGELIETVRK